MNKAYKEENEEREENCIKHPYAFSTLHKLNNATKIFEKRSSQTESAISQQTRAAVRIEAGKN